MLLEPLDTPWGRLLGLPWALLEGQTGLENKPNDGPLFSKAFLKLLEHFGNPWGRLLGFPGPLLEEGFVPMSLRI